MVRCAGNNCEAKIFDINRTGVCVVTDLNGNFKRAYCQACSTRPPKIKKSLEYYPEGDGFVTVQKMRQQAKQN